MDGQIASEKERYKQKLESVGLTLSDDPFMKDNDHRFSDDMTLWPRIEYGHIFGYFINRRELILKSSCYLGSNLKPTTTLNRAS